MNETPTRDESSGVRLVVMIDFEDLRPEDAYLYLRKHMGNIPYEWESTDEAYWLEDGERVSPRRLEKMRMYRHNAVKESFDVCPYCGLYQV